MTFRCRKPFALSVFWLLFAAAGLATAVSTAAAFEVRIRAEGHLSVDVAAAGTRLQVSGHLRDELQNGLPQRRLVVSVTAPGQATPIVEQAVYTGMRGQFQVHEDLAPGTYDVVIDFPETDHVAGARQTHRLNVAAQPTALRVQAPTYVHAPDGPVRISVHATAGSVGLQVPVELRGGDDYLGLVELDRFGRGSLDVAGRFEPGAHAIEAYLPETRYRDAANARTILRIGHEPTLDAELRTVLERFERGLSVVGQARDAFGPVPDVSVRVAFVRANDASAGGHAGGGGDEAHMEGDAVRSDDAAVQRTIERAVRTDGQGAFAAFVPAGELGDGEWFARVELLPAVGKPVAVETASVSVDRQAMRRLVRTLGLIGLGAGLLLAGQRAYARLRRRLDARAERRERERQRDDALASRATIVPVALDADADGAGVASGPARTSLGGVVWDAWQRRPIAGATLDVVRADDGHEVAAATSAPGGRFGLGALEPGRYRLAVQARGFVRGELGFEVPHTGTLANFRLDLVAVPLKIRRIYQVTIEALEGTDLWGRLSPREIEEVIVQALETGALETGALETGALETSDVVADATAETVADAAPDATSAGSVGRGGGVAALRPAIREQLATLFAGGDRLPPQTDPRALVEVLTRIVEESYFSGRLFDEQTLDVAREIALRLEALAGPEVTR